MENNYLPIKTNANKRKSVHLIEESVIHRRQSLEDEINQEREKLVKKLIVFQDEIERKPIKGSLTDPDRSYYHRSHKEEGFMYLDHQPWMANTILSLMPTSQKGISTIANHT